jgi:hypothetical protein
MGNWRKSTYSGANGGDCVEVASTDGVMIRDTTDRSGMVLRVSAKSWQIFTISVRQSRSVLTSD